MFLFGAPDFARGTSSGKFVSRCLSIEQGLVNVGHVCIYSYSDEEVASI